MKKKLFSVILIVAMIFSLNMVALAQDDTVIDASTVKDISEKYQVGIDEILHLKENLETALASHSTELCVREGERDEKIIPISDNLRLVLTLEVDNSEVQTRSGTRLTLTHRGKIDNLVGMELVSLASVGVFENDGSTCEPVDAYCSYETTLATITNTESELGSPAYNSWVRNTFEGETTYSIGPVSGTISTFSYASTITCNALGEYAATWN